jgi:hypothetical protein
MKSSTQSLLVAAMFTVISIVFNDTRLVAPALFFLGVTLVCEALEKKK